jgi:hypothetical protein
VSIILGAKYPGMFFPPFIITVPAPPYGSLAYIRWWIRETFGTTPVVRETADARGLMAWVHQDLDDERLALIRHGMPDRVPMGVTWSVHRIRESLTVTGTEPTFADATAIEMGRAYAIVDVDTGECLAVLPIEKSPPRG